VELAERQIQRVSRIHPPHSQRPHTLALDQSLPQELLQGELDRTWRAVDPANELACVEFLSRRAGQEGEEPGLGCGPSYVGHGRHRNTCVFNRNTPVSTIRRQEREVAQKPARPGVRSLRGPVVEATPTTTLTSISSSTSM